MVQASDTDSERSPTVGMDAALKAKWVEALRSGKYEQAQKTLRRHNKFCCLGVLCDLTNPNDWTLVEGDPGQYRHMDMAGFPSITLERQWGLTLDLMSSLSGLNDRGHPFAVIADYIENNIPTRTAER